MGLTEILQQESSGSSIFYLFHNALFLKGITERDSKSESISISNTLLSSCAYFFRTIVYKYLSAGNLAKVLSLLF